MDLNKSEYSDFFKRRDRVKIIPVWYPLSSPKFVYKKLDFSGKKILDFGSSFDSPNVQEALKKGADYHGFDIDKQTVQWLKEKNYFADFWKSKEKFDIVLVSQVYEHLSKEQQEALIKRSAQVVRSGGFLVLEYPYLNNLGGNNFWRDRTHTTPPSLEDEAIFIEKFGFRAELYVAGISFWGPRNFLRMVFNWLLGFHPQHNVVIIAQEL
ncbi:MAG: methyltransferase domain-containing protein [Candidatus Diapherotrites archaeon]